MPRKSLVIRDFIGGIVPSEDSSLDLNSRSLSVGSNINFNKDKGRIVISGAFSTFQKPDESTNILEDYETPQNLKGCRGKGLFYFTSDYDNLTGTNNNSSEEEFESAFTSVPGVRGPHFIIGPEASTNKPTSYLVIASRNKSTRDTQANISRGHQDAVLHIYEERHDGIHGKVPNGTYNGWLVNIPMGHEDVENTGANQGSNAFSSSSNADYMRDWFPVYYYANGGLRISDGSFNKENYNIITLEYIDDDLPFQNIDTAIGGSGNYTNYQGFRVNGWTMSRNNLLNKPGLPGPEDFIGVREYVSSGTPYFNGTDAVFVGKPDTVFYLSLHKGSTPSDSFGPINPNGTGLANSAGGINFYSGSGGQGEVFDVYTGTTDTGIALPEDGQIAISLGYERDGADGLPGGNITMHPGYRLLFSYVYHSGEESIPIQMKENGKMYKTDDTELTKNGSSQFIDNGEKNLKDIILQPIVFCNVLKRRRDPRIKGFRVYSTGIGAPVDEETIVDKDEKLLFECNWWKGMRIAGSGRWTSWQVADENSSSTTARCYSGGAARCAEIIRDVLPAETFESFHGYDYNDITSCQYKTAVVANNRVYAGNVILNSNNDDPNQPGKRYPDRIMKTQIGEFDTFVDTPAGILALPSDDGDEIHHIVSFADRLLVYKKNTCYVINIAQEQEFIEMTAKYAGATSPSQVQVTDKGVYWVNSNGFYWYNGEIIVNILEDLGYNWTKRIDFVSISELTPQFTFENWNDLVSSNDGEEPILSYDPTKKDLIIHFQNENTDELIIFNVDASTGLDRNTDFNYISGVTASSATNWEGLNESSGPAAGVGYLNVTLGSGTGSYKGFKLSLSSDDDYVSPIVTGETYQVEVTLSAASGNTFASTTAFKVRLGANGSYFLLRETTEVFGATAIPTDQSLITMQASIVANLAGSNDYLEIVKDTDDDDAGILQMHNISLSKKGTSQMDHGFIWNTENNNMSQILYKTSALSTTLYKKGGGKSNSIIDSFGNSRYVANSIYANRSETNSNTNGKGTVQKWNADPASAYLSFLDFGIQTQSIDFENHARRKVIQSINFTYTSSTDTYLTAYATATYLNGNSPKTYYLCHSDASSITEVNILVGAAASMKLPTTSGKLETFTFKHVLSNEDAGDASSMRQKLKNIGSIKIGLVKFSTLANIPVDFELEEISITYKEKSIK